MAEVAGLVLRGVRLAGAADPAGGGAPVDVAVVDGRVSAVGVALDVPGAEVIDAGGRWLMPGLWDEHVHVTQWALGSDRVALGAATSAAEALALVRAALVASGPLEHGLPLIGSGFRDAIWPDAPSRAALDAVSGDTPVVLQSHDIHCVWLNSAGARWAGVAVDESGLLREAPAFAVNQLLNALPDDVVDARVRRAGLAAAALGVVGVVDFEMAWNRDIWQRRLAGGFASQRIEAALYPQHLDQGEAEGLRTGLIDPDIPLLSVGPLKTLIDGALNTRTAFCADHYPDGSSGMLIVAPDELTALLQRADRLGFVPAVHAIGDAAITAALDGFAAAGVGGRIEHAQLVASDDLPRFAAVGVTASAQPAHLLDDRDVAELHWPGRTGRAFPLRALLDAGTTLAFGSDAPVARLDPWLAIRAAVERAVPGDKAWHPEQRVSVGEALRASSRGRDAVGVGDVADVVLLDEPPERMRGEAVAAALVAGEFTYRDL